MTLKQAAMVEVPETWLCTQPFDHLGVEKPMLSKFDLIYVTEFMNISGTGSTGCQLDLAVSEGVGRRRPAHGGYLPAGSPCSRMSSQPF